MSLTLKNNLKYFLLLAVAMSTLIVLAITNARYETTADLTAQANFPTTILEISSIDTETSYEVTAEESIKIQYSITNTDNSKTNNNNIQYYLNLVDTLGNNAQNVSIKVRVTPTVDDGATYDTVTSLNYVQGKGYGPITLKQDGTAETKNFDVFVKANNVSSTITLNLKMRAYVESVTNTNYNLVKTADMQLRILPVGGSSESTDIFVYTTAGSVAKIIGLSEVGIETIDSLTKLEIPAEYNNLPVTEVNLGTSVNNKTNLTEIVIPASITNLAKTTFYGCSNVVDLTCPLSLDMSDVFNSSTNKIETITFTADSTNKDGFNYTQSTYTKTPWYYSKDLLEPVENNQEPQQQEPELKALTITFDAKIESIGDYTFKDLTRFKDTISNILVFDNTLTKIGTYAFYNTQITGSIDVGNAGITKVLGENAFNASVTINNLDTNATPEQQPTSNPEENVNQQQNNQNSQTPGQTENTEQNIQQNSNGLNSNENNEGTTGGSSNTNSEENTNQENSGGSTQEQNPGITNEITNTII